MGNRVHFWVDDWLSVGPLSFLFPRLFRVAINRRAWVNKCFKEPKGFVAWVVPFRRSLRQFERVEFEALLCLFSNILICRDLEDCRGKPL